jgi:chromosome segregation ATPase
VEQAAVVTDFANALFVHRGVVQTLNHDIKRLGGEKVEILKEVRDFRKGIAELVWENERLAMEGGDLVDRTREFQLLRVTKDLQKLMKGGGEDRHTAEVSQLERKLEAMGQAHETRIAERERQLAKMRRLKAEKDSELERLYAQIGVRVATGPHPRRVPARRPQASGQACCAHARVTSSARD